jgi:hypothetical protein
LIFVTAAMGRLQAYWLNTSLRHHTPLPARMRSRGKMML